MGLLFITKRDTCGLREQILCRDASVEVGFRPAQRQLLLTLMGADGRGFRAELLAAETRELVAKIRALGEGR